MANCYLQSYNARIAKAEGKKLSFIEKLILLRSDPHTHSEIQFSERYDHISFSATLRDGCKCCRFRQIYYHKHPNRWKTDVIPFNVEQEDMAWREACRLAGLPVDWRHEQLIDNYRHNNCYYHAKYATKYDIWGQPCHISKWNIWKPNLEKIWCSTAVLRAIFAPYDIYEQAINYPELYVNRNEVMPNELAKYVKLYWKGGA